MWHSFLLNCTSNTWMEYPRYHSRSIYDPTRGKFRRHHAPDLDLSISDSVFDISFHIPYSPLVKVFDMLRKWVFFHLSYPYAILSILSSIAVLLTAIIPSSQANTAPFFNPTRLRSRLSAQFILKIVPPPSTGDTCLPRISFLCR